MSAKTQPNQVRAIAVFAALLMSSALFSGVVSLADQPAPTLSFAQANVPIQR